MVAIGRALMSRPRLLLLDEPSGGLSPQLVADTARTMSLLLDLGMTMLVVEQNLGLALKAADRYLILRDGEVADGGPVSALAGQLRRHRARHLPVKERFSIFALARERPPRPGRVAAAPNTTAAYPPPRRSAIAGSYHEIAQTIYL